MTVRSFDYEASLAACADGNEQALQELYRQEAPHMLALCMQMLANAHDAEDAIRDAFVLIWKNAESYDPTTGTARAWIYSIMRYRILNRLRQLGRPNPTSIDAPAFLPSLDSSNGNTPTPLVQRLAQLSEVQHQPILMAFYHGLTYEQMATRQKIPAAQLKIRVRAGLHAIQGVS